MSTMLSHWCCHFTYVSTRVVQLEIVQDLTVESFLLAFGFTSRKSLPRKMYQVANASTYTVAAEDLQKSFQFDTLKEP